MRMIVTKVFKYRWILFFLKVETNVRDARKLLLSLLFFSFSSSIKLSTEYSFHD